MVPVSVTVKTVILDVAPVYPDGADLPQTTAKNVNLIKRYFKYHTSYLIHKVIRFKLKVFLLFLLYDMTSFSEHILSVKCYGYPS